jgi:transposase
MAKIHFRPYNPNQTVLFPQRIDEDIAENDPVRMVNALVESLNLESFRKLYKECGRSPYHPRMMLKVILYAYMNNIYSCRKIESLLHRDIHYIWLAGHEKPDFITINRFRNRVKTEINEVFTQVVLLLSSRGFISLNVEYIDGTKIESKANKYTFVWRKTVERNRERLMKKIHVLLGQIDDAIAREKASESNEEVAFTPAMLTEMAENTVFLLLTALIRNFYKAIIHRLDVKRFGLNATSRIKAFVFRFVSVPAKWIRTSRRYVLNIYTCNNAYADIFQTDFG